MVENADETTQVPAAPDGYTDSARFQYPHLRLTGIVIVIGPPAALLYGYLLWNGHGPGVLESLFGFQQSAAGFSFSIPLGTILVTVLAIVAVTILHELVHGLVLRARGYHVSYGLAPHLGAVYAAAFEQFYTREDCLLVAATPLVVLTTLLVPLLFVPSPLVAFVASVALLFNTMGAAGDLYLIARLRRMPAGTLLYDSDIHNFYVFYPETS